MTLRKNGGIDGGATDFLSQLYGDAGAHAGSAVGMCSLPDDAHRDRDDHGGLGLT